LVTRVENLQASGVQVVVVLGVGAVLVFFLAVLYFVSKQRGRGASGDGTDGA